MSSVGFKQLEALSKEFKLSKEIQVDATELRIRAERRLGEMLKVMEKNQGVGMQGKDKFGGHIEVPPKAVSTLSDLGITKNDSSKFQRLASIAEPSFETTMSDLKEQAIAGKQSALSTTGVIKEKFSKTVCKLHTLSGRETPSFAARTGLRISDFKLAY